MVVIQAKGNDTAGYTTYFNLVAGDSVSVDVEFDNIDLTGADIRMTIALPTPLELNNDNGGIVVVNAALGQIRIVIASAVTEAWKPCEFPFDLWVIPSAGVANNYLKGFFVVTRGQTVVP